VPGDESQQLVSPLGEAEGGPASGFAQDLWITFFNSDLGHVS